MNLKITIEEYQIIRKALMKLPAEEVYSLIANLDSQIVEQSKTLPMAQPSGGN